MVDPNIIETLDSDWIDDFLEDNEEDVTNLLEYDDTSGLEIDIEYTTDW